MITATYIAFNLATGQRWRVTCEVQSRQVLLEYLNDWNKEGGWFHYAEGNETIGLPKPMLNKHEEIKH